MYRQLNSTLYSKKKMHYLIAILSKTNIVHEHAHTHRLCPCRHVQPNACTPAKQSMLGTVIHFFFVVLIPRNTQNACVTLSNRRPNVNGINGRNENLWFNIKIYFIQAKALKFPHYFQIIVDLC